MGLIARLQERLLGVAPWDAGQITDEWFRAHFEYAADVVNHWVGSVLDIPKSQFLNFGCGDGITDLSLALRYGATSIHGVDVRREYQKLPRIAREQLGMQRVPVALTFETIQSGDALAQAGVQYDGIMSWSTFEHVRRDQLATILADLHACLRPGGYFFIQIEPLYFSPYGSHLRRYDDTPWHHLLATEDELWKVIENHQGPIDPAEVDFGFADFGVDGYKRFVFNEYKALNRLTADELVQFAKGAGFSVAREERRTVDLEVPEGLLSQYPRDWLVNNEIFLLLRKD
ncbi:class I SAM-dependent methyltransferase [Acidovorax sp. 1608163]|uniref:SAM-dependent methyltransferase n=1 Tax=Acidovorax sp. 1608163 TaxID=2478662 RepID=UPI000EF6D782|nr:class I SAM-dependent methyltransferase [Acidovorax sp. 1608163]AYM97751.1 class I SAM-dependent methyltransferase [Acidovorax sp. 1608163]